MKPCDTRETWLTNLESLLRDLEESLVKRGYKVSLEEPARGSIYMLHIQLGQERALMVVEKQYRSYKHLSPLDKYIDPYALKITIESTSDNLCSLLKLLLMKGGG